MENYLSKFNKDEKILLKNLLSRSKLVSKNNKTISSDFLDVYELSLALNFLNKFKIKYTIFDFDGFLERKVILFNEGYNDVTLLKVETKSKNLKHKDYMGAIYNLGVNTNKIGDIVIIDDICYFFVINSVVDYFLNNLIMVGNALVEVKEVNYKDIELKKNFEYKVKSVSSLRIDLCLAKLFNISRNKMIKHFDKGDVILNSIECNNKTKEIKIDDVIAFKKHGKFAVNDIGLNNKHKYVISFKIYN